MIKKITGIPGAIISFLREVGQELKLVEFPTRKATLRSTYLVLGVSLLFGIALFLLDSLFILVRNYLTSLPS